MNVEIINVGTELLLGEIVNTNATYLQKMCKELGFNVFFQTVVGDNPQRFLDCLNIAFNRGCDCVITTGGLGPTEDDLTKELSAKYLGLEMIYNEAEAKKVNDKCCFVSQLDGFIPLVFQYHSCQLLTVQELLETVVTEAVVQKSDQCTNTNRYQYGYEVVRGKRQAVF